MMAALLLMLIVSVDASPVRMQRLYGTFMAPCCWHENLNRHQSPKATELRSQIDRFVSAGLSDEAIKQKLVAEYSKRILAVPEGRAGEVLRWAPVTAAIAGLAIVLLAIRRMLKPPAEPPEPERA
jgi:cytochrome c-type biogenesis protein CcmH/NrfF